MKVRLALGSLCASALVAMPLSAAVISVGTPVQLSSSGIVDPNLPNSGAFEVDVSGEGTIDWAVWGFTGSGFNTGTQVFNPNNRKSAVGGGAPAVNKITQLSLLTADTGETFGFANSNVGPRMGFAGTWTGGITPANDRTTATRAVVRFSESTTNPAAGSSSELGDGFRLTVEADTQPLVANLYVYARRMEGSVLGTIGAASDSATFDQTDANVPELNIDALWRVPITFTGDFAGQVLTVDYTISNLTPTQAGRSIGFSAVTLAPIPEPGAIAAAAGLVGVMLRRRSR